MTPTRLPDEGVELAWRKIERRLSQLEGFAFLVVFVRDLALVAPLRERALAWLAERGESLTVIAEAVPEALSDRSIQALFTAVESAPSTPIWLEAHRGWLQPSWDEERVRLLSLLNERRSRLEVEAKAPLVLLVPDGAERLVSSVAQDLWHARFLTTVLARRLPLPMAAMAGMAVPASTGLSMPDPRAAIQLDEARKWLDRWRAMFGDAVQVPATMLEDERVRSLQVGVAADLARLMLRNGEVELAAAMSRRLVALARVRDESAGSQVQRGATTGSLITALGVARQVASEQGQFGEALAFSREELEASKALAKHLSSKIGSGLVASALGTCRSAAVAAGEPDLAHHIAQEELALRRQLVSELGPSSTVLRGLVVSLNGAGVVEQYRGHHAQAQALFAEALEQARRRALSRDSDDAVPVQGAIANSAANLAFSLAVQDELEGATRVLEEALDVLDKDLTDDASAAGLLPEAIWPLNALAFATERGGRKASVEGPVSRLLAAARRQVEREGRSAGAMVQLRKLLIPAAALLGEPARTALDHERAEVDQELQQRFPQMKLE